MDFHDEVSKDEFPNLMWYFDRQKGDDPLDYTAGKSAMIAANNGTTERPAILLSYELSSKMQAALWSYREFESQKYLVVQLERRQKLALKQHEELRSETKLPASSITLSENPKRMEEAEKKLSRLANEIAEQSQIARAAAKKMHRHQWDMMYLLEPVFVNCYLVTRPPETFVGQAFSEVEFLTYSNSADSSDLYNKEGPVSKGYFHQEGASKKLGELEAKAANTYRTFEDHYLRTPVSSLGHSEHYRISLRLTHEFLRAAMMYYHEKMKVEDGAREQGFRNKDSFQPAANDKKNNQVADANIREWSQRAIPVKVEPIPPPPTTVASGGPSELAFNESASRSEMKKRLDRHYGDHKELRQTEKVTEEGHTKKGWLKGGAVVAGAVAAGLLICLYIWAWLEECDETRDEAIF